MELNGDARAYPVQFIGYHHQVRDTVGGTPVLVSFCTVCRTGRVFSPLVDRHEETFRLVGMDHFNAMFEDRTTGTWWRQANGEAIAGPKKGAKLAEIPTEQVTLGTWLALHPGEVFGSGTAAGGSGLELDRWLQEGDVVELEIEGIGVLRNTIGRKGA